MPLRLALLPAVPETFDLNCLLDDLVAAPGLTGICPRWFAFEGGGDCRALPKVQERVLRLFARYYRLRLLPVIAVSAGADPSPLDLETLAQSCGADGFVLCFAAAPPAAARDRLREAFAGSGLVVLAVVTETGARQAQGLPLAAAQDLVPRQGDALVLPLISMTADPWEERLDELPADQPVLLVY